MNKPPPQIVYTRQPIQSTRAPIPTIRFKHSTSGQQGETSNVKRYLDNVKQHHQEDASSVRISLTESRTYEANTQAEMLRANEQRLRQRINQLEMENNELRSAGRECEELNKRNEQLEEQMLLLLQEFENKQSPITFRTEESQYDGKQGYSTKERNFNTEESSYEEVSARPEFYSFKEDPRDEEGSNPFKNIVIKEMEESEESRQSMSPERLNIIIDERIKDSVRQLQTKFLSYVQSIQMQMVQIKRTNDEILKIQHFSDKHAAKQSRRLVKYDTKSNKKDDCQSQKMLNSEQIRQNKFHGKKELNSQLLNINKKDVSLKKSQERQVSQINIELGSITSSNPSFGHSQFYQPEQVERRYQTPQNREQSKPESSEESFYYYQPLDQSEIQFSMNPFADKFTTIIMSRVFDALQIMREHLTFVLAEKSKLTDTSIDRFEEKVYRELKSILENFFEKPLEKAKASEAQKSEQTKMKDHILYLNEQIILLRDRLNQKVSQGQQPKSKSQPNNSSPDMKTVPMSISCEQFVQTQKRLIRVIEVMKSFNSEYQNILHRSQGPARQAQSANQFQK